MSGDAQPDRYSNEEFGWALGKALADLITPAEAFPVSEKRAVLLGGQNGAGKIALHRIYRKRFGKNVIVVSGDEFRSLHPRFKDIQAVYGIDAPAHTARWSEHMAEALIDAFSEDGYNLIIEGTLRTSEAPRKTAELLRSRGYDVSLALMAVKPEISLASCKIRYEMLKAAGTTLRATDPEHHNAIARDIADSLAELERSGLFSSVCLYDRAERCLYPTGDPSDTASGVLRRVLFGPWTEEEREHLAYLERKLAAYTGDGRA